MPFPDCFPAAEDTAMPFPDCSQQRRTRQCRFPTPKLICVHLWLKNFLYYQFALKLMASPKSSNKTLPKLLLLLLPVVVIAGAWGFNTFSNTKSADKPEVLNTSSAETLVVSLKRPLAEATEALGDNNFLRAKRELGEFQEFWAKVEPMFKEKAPEAHQQINSELNLVKESLGDSPDRQKATAAFNKLSQTVEANTSKVMSSQASTAVESPKPEASSATKLSPEALVGLKRPMAEGIEAIKDANFTRAKREYEEFLGLWKQSEKGVKQKSPAVFDEVEVGMDSVYAALIEPKNPDKQKAIAAFEQMQKTLNKL